MSEMVETVWRERYAHPGETCWQDTAERVARFVSTCEKDPVWYDIFANAITSQRFMPGGRILANAGRPQGQLLNCFVLPLADSREAIGQMLKEFLIISGTGGGVGISFSKLRPTGTPIMTNGGTSSGPISFMDCVDQIAATIKTGGSRRAATMISLSVYHPDVLEFVHHKIDLAKLTNANISIEVDSKFLDAVRNGENWDLIWNNKVVRTIEAQALWDRIVENALTSGEPGILNMGYARATSNAYYFDDLVTANPCSEQLLPAYGSCCLGSINLSAFIGGKDEFLWEEAKACIRTGIRFLDDVLSVNTFPLPKIKEQSVKERRIGLGLMGLHHALIKMGIKYSSSAGLEFTEKIYEVLRNTSYIASADLALEKGSFPAFDAEQYLDSGFARTLPTKIRAKIRDQGMRNVCVNTQAPTGTTSILAETSSGIEPIFAPMYVRRYNTEKGSSKMTMVDPLLKEFIATNRKISNFEGAYDIPPEKHFVIQEAAQRYLDSGVSKTINLPEDYTSTKLNKIWLKYADKLKGATLYRSGSRGKEPLKPIDIDTTLITTGDAEASNERCKTGSCVV